MIYLNHLDLDKLFLESKGIAIFLEILGLTGKLFNKGKLSEIKELYLKLKSQFKDRFYIEIQRHGDQNETGLKNHLDVSLELEIPIIATNEVLS